MKSSQSDIFYFKSNPDQMEAQTFTPEQVDQFFYLPNFRFRAFTIQIDGKEELKIPAPTA